MEKVMKIFKRLFKFSLKMFLRAQRFVKKSITRSFFIFVQTVELSTLTPGAMITTIFLTLLTGNENALQNFHIPQNFPEMFRRTLEIMSAWVLGFKNAQPIKVFQNTALIFFILWISTASNLFNLKRNLAALKKSLRALDCTMNCFQLNHDISHTVILLSFFLS